MEARYRHCGLGLRPWRQLGWQGPTFKAQDHVMYHDRKGSEGISTPARCRLPFAAEARSGPSEGTHIVQERVKIHHHR